VGGFSGIGHIAQQHLFASFIQPETSFRIVILIRNSPDAMTKQTSAGSDYLLQIANAILAPQVVRQIAMVQCLQLTLKATSCLGHYLVI
jgi:hypothetical protein